MIFLAALVPAAFSLGDALLVATGTLLTRYVVKEVYDYATDRDGKSERRGEQRGEARAKTEYGLQMQRFEIAMQQKCADEERYFDVVLAVTTVGYAYAAAIDGEVTEKKRGYIDDFVCGQATTRLPPRLRRKLKDLFLAPPDAETAYQDATAIAPDAMELCDMIIELLTTSSEGAASRSARNFLKSWQQLKSAA